MTDVTKPKQHQYGLSKIRVGSSHQIRNAEGEHASVTCIDSRDKAGLDPKARPFCLKCQRSYASIQEMHTAHPEERVMQRQRESHPWGLWSDRPIRVQKITHHFGSPQPERNDKGEIIMVDTVVGLTSDRLFDAH